MTQNMKTVLLRIRAGIGCAFDDSRTGNPQLLMIFAFGIAAHLLAAFVRCQQLLKENGAVPGQLFMMGRAFWRSAGFFGHDARKQAGAVGDIQPVFQMTKTLAYGAIVDPLPVDIWASPFYVPPRLHPTQ